MQVWILFKSRGFGVQAPSSVALPSPALHRLIVLVSAQETVAFKWSLEPPPLSAGGSVPPARMGSNLTEDFPARFGHRVLGARFCSSGCLVWRTHCEIPPRFARLHCARDPITVNFKSIRWKLTILEIRPMLSFWPRLTSKIIGWLNSVT